MDKNDSKERQVHGTMMLIHFQLYVGLYLSAIIAWIFKNIALRIAALFSGGV